MLMITLAAGAPTTLLAATEYFYDDLGRLVFVVYDDGSAITYEYDASGNRTASHQWTAEAPVIGGFTPDQGPAGSTLTILGTGFAPNPPDNEVRIGGALAPVTSASTTTLVVTVPMAAQTGFVAVTVAGESATSSEVFVVLRPDIVDFAPHIVEPSGSVTLTGENLALVAGGTTVSVAQQNVVTTSLNNTEVQFEAPTSGSGYITVATPYGNAVSAGELAIIPGFIGAGNVVDHTTRAPDGVASSISINEAEKLGVLEFDAAIGQWLTLNIESVITDPSNTSIRYDVYAPSGSLVLSGYVNQAGETAHLPRIVEDGPHYVAFDTGSTQSAQISASIEQDQLLDTEGSTIASATSYAGATKRLVFTAIAGDDLGLGLTNLILSSGTRAYVNLYQPNGSALGSTNYCYSQQNGCSIELRDLPETGEYTAKIRPQYNSATMSFNATLSENVTGTLAAGAPQTIDLTVPGQQALLEFTAVAGQDAAVNLNIASTNPTGESVAMRIYRPNGSQLASTNTNTSRTINITDLDAGSHTILIVPQYAATASVIISLADGMGGALPSDGTTQSVATSVPGQEAYFTFTANAGDDLGLGLTNLTLSAGNRARLYVYRPNGSYLGSTTYCYSYQNGCSVELMDLPDTGEYTVKVRADNVFANMSFDITLSQNVTGTLAAGSPQTVDLTVPGQQALLEFTATASQNVAINLDVTSTTPTGTTVAIRTFGPSGSQIDYTSTNASRTVNLTNLDAGTHTVLVVPQYAAIANVTLSLADGMGGLLPSDGTTQSVASSVPGQEAYFTFMANAGDDLGLGLTNLTLSAGNRARLYVYRPNGSMLGSTTYCYSYQNGCSVELMDLPDTGEYTVKVRPDDISASISFAITLSHNATGMLAAGSPQTVDLTVPGQQALLEFTATAGQNAAINLNVASTNPAGQSVVIRTFGPSGSQIDYTTTNTSRTVNLTDLDAGTHTILVVPQYAATASAIVSLVDGMGGALPSDGTTQSVASSVPGQEAYFTFTANAGDDLGLGLTNLTLSAGNRARLYVYRPNGSYFGSTTYCYSYHNGCSVELMDLPDAGEYTVKIRPDDISANMSFDITLSQTVTGTLAAGSPQTVDLTVPGQQALLEFTATTGQDVVIALNVISTNPVGTYVQLRVYGPSGSTVGSTGTTGLTSLSLMNLVAGPHSVHIAPQHAATASVSLELQ